jgi:hypothetical protein
MPTQAPEETDLLCENCGYMLNGLPADGNCPECGSTIDLSVSERFRQPSAWESRTDRRPRWLRFLATSRDIILRPTRFFRSTTSRGQIDVAYQFAQIHWAIAAVLLGLAAWFHWLSEASIGLIRVHAVVNVLILLALPLVVYLFVSGTISLAARLTTWEARYRGYRLPLNVVLRALYFHSAHLLPVAIVALLTCGGYYFFFHPSMASTTGAAYLYTLSGEVIVAAGYLFQTYWIGMRGWMYANR